METALADLGIQPTVISSADACAGALPLVHVRHLILKVNGDYLDTRLKNTAAELEQYEPVLSRLIDRILDEFGLIVCGWSGEWDIALRGAIERTPNRRFPTYWTNVHGLTEKANDLVKHRAAQVIKIEGADTFFRTLNEKTLALAQFDRPHPLSARTASEQVKRYLTRPEDKILLHDLVISETERAYAAMDPRRFPTDPVAAAISRVRL